MGNKYILVVSIIGLLICTHTGCSNLDSKKNKFDQQVNLAARNKVKDKVDSKHLGNKSDGIEPTSSNSEGEADENEQALLVTLKKKINKSLPEYIFKIYGEKDDSFLAVNKIKINEEQKEEKLIQEINIEDSNIPNSIENAGVELVDANFDGYLDLQVQMGMGAGPNVFYSYWLWNKDTSKYVPNDELSQLTSTKFDNLNKTVTSENSSQAGAYYIQSVYKFLDGKLTLIKETERIADTEKRLFNYTVKELMNNELKVTKQYSEPYEE